MRKHFSRYLILSIVTFFAHIFFINTSYIFAGITLKGEAASYREKGYEFQKTGDMDNAMSWYQKAAELDPKYAAPHNDLGILFETKGWLDRAETEYQKAITIDPGYQKAHTNLALLYERKGELEKAAFHWMRRFKLGEPGDPWTEEARERLEKLSLIDKKDVPGGKILPAKEQASMVPEQKMDEEGWTRLGAKDKKPPKEKTVQATQMSGERKKGEWTKIGAAAKPKAKKEKIAQKQKKAGLEDELKESLRLAEERLRQEKMKEQKSKPAEKVAKSSPVSPEAGSYYAKAEGYYKKGEYSRALDTIRIAKNEHKDDQALLELEQTIKDKMKEERIEDHYNEGLMRYHQEDYKGAREEFEAILNILPE